MAAAAAAADADADADAVADADAAGSWQMWADEMALSIHASFLPYQPSMWTSISP